MGISVAEPVVMSEKLESENMLQFTVAAYYAKEMVFKEIYLGLQVGFGAIFTLKACQCESNNKRTYTADRLPVSQAQKPQIKREP